MTTRPIKSTIWRDRAEEYRRFAEEAGSAEGRRAYLGIAENCDEMAERLEKQETARATHSVRVLGSPVRRPRGRPPLTE